MNAVVTSRTDRFVQQACALPAMPEVANKLLRSFDRDDLSLNELAGLIGRDQTLSARVLRLANSARYSPSRSVTSLNEAAMTLGTRTLRDLALSACMVGMFPSIPGFDRLAFWRTTLATAAYAQPLARFLEEDEDAAYLGGLMLRTGQLLMLMVDPDMTQRIGRLSLEIDSRISFENSLLGCSHPEITAELARHWRFPNTLVTAFGVFFMRQYLVDVIPDELIEAARVDGASMISTFFNVGIPAARPAMGILSMFTFMTAWTDYLWPLLVVPQNPTLQVALSQLQSAKYVDYSVVLNGAVLATLPLLVLFVIAGKQLVSGIMAGAVKG